MPAYKRPSLPPAAGLAERSAALKASNDRLAASLGDHPTGLRARPPAIPAAELASSIRAQNEARIARSEMNEEQENARVELLTHTEMIINEYADNQTVRFFAEGTREFLLALGAKTPMNRIEALRAMRTVMREAVLSMDRVRGIGSR